MKFSLVCPVKDEVDLLPYTLPSFYAVNPSEVVLCLDDPAPQHVEHTIHRIATACGCQDTTRIIKVAPNPAYTYQQAWIRRKGFMEAKYDRILNTDVDLVLNRNVLKAVDAVGKHNVGLASLNKISIQRMARDHMKHVQLKLRHRLFQHVRPLKRTFFTGLYALWRPYWLDSEPSERVKRFVGVKQMWRGTHSWLDCMDKPRGEDSFLKECLQKKHRRIFFTDVGATVLREDPEYMRYLYYIYGQHAGLNGGNLFKAIAYTLRYQRSDYLQGYLGAKA